jgi:hypothetical protein
MAWKKHNRHVTQEQFSDGTTIDGSRVERALQELENHVNEIPEGDIKNKFTQTQFVSGWMPHAEGWADGSDYATSTGGNYNVELGVRESTGVTGTIFPFLPVYNSAKNLSQVAPVVEPPSYTNKHRHKGYQTAGVPVNPGDGFGFEQTGGTNVPASIYEDTGQYSWQNAWSFKRPVVVKNLTIFMLTDSIDIAGYSAAKKNRMPFRNDWAFDNPPIPYSAGSYSEDVSIELSVDDLFLSENRALNNSEIVKHKFAVGQDNISQILQPIENSTSDMKPDFFPGGRVKGIYISVDCEVPIPQESRVRMSLMLPKYDKQGGSFGSLFVHGGWKGVPWFRQYYSSCLTILEELE